MSDLTGSDTNEELAFCATSLLVVCGSTICATVADVTSDTVVLVAVVADSIVSLEVASPVNSVIPAVGSVVVMSGSVEEEFGR